MKTFNIFSANDWKTGMYRWSWVYLHGEAEEVFPRGDEAPDLFYSDEPKPEEEGNYLCSIDGQPAIAVLSKRYNTLDGRISLITDTKALKHTLTPEDWR